MGSRLVHRRSHTLGAVPRTPAREQVLIQPSIAGFLNPAPSQGGPTRGKLVTSPDQNPTAGEALNCGSPCKIDEMPIDEQKGGEAFGDTTDMRSLNVGLQIV